MISSISASSGIILFLGSVHLAYTFLTHKFSLTEKQSETAMKQVAPQISGENTTWKVWIGIHVSHTRSRFWIGLELLWLVGYILLAQIYWFWILLIGGLFSHAALPRGTSWHICTRMRGEKENIF